MKKLLLSISVALGTFFSAQAQELPEYQRFIFSQSTSTYAPLSSAATEVEYEVFEGDTTWDDFVTESIPMPFPFKYQNVDVTSFAIDSYGALIFNETLIDEIEAHVLGLYMDYAGAEDRGKILYETVGTVGSRILKIEFQNVSTYNNHTGNDTLNFQMWLHEGTNVIETHAGYTNIPDEFFAQSIADLMGEEPKETLLSTIMTNEGDELKTAPADLYFHHVTNMDGVYGDDLMSVSEALEDEMAPLNMLLGVFPAEGTIFRYTPISETTGLEQVTAADMNIYPNPASTFITLNMTKGIDMKGASYTIYDLYGRVISTGQLPNAQSEISINHLTSGQYFLQVTTETHQGVKQFTKL